MRMTSKKYADYLASDHWKLVRDKRLQMDNYRCWCCDKKATQVHHITYDRVGREPMSDVISVCKTCHSAIHQIEKTEKVSLYRAHRRLRERVHPRRGDFLLAEEKRRAEKKANKPRRKKTPEQKRYQLVRRTLRARGDLCMGCGYRTETVYCPYPEENWTANNCKPLCSLCQKPVVQMVGVGWDYRDAIRNWNKLQKFSPKTREQMVDRLLSQGPSDS